MKLVIDIPAVTYEEVKWRGLYLCPRDSEALVNSIKNGTPYEARPHGEWVQVTDEDGDYLYHKCSNCGQKVESELDNPPFFNFCMDCGADMRPKKEGEEK